MARKKRQNRICQRKNVVKEQNQSKANNNQTLSEKNELSYPQTNETPFGDLVGLKTNVKTVAIAHPTNDKLFGGEAVLPESEATSSPMDGRAKSKLSDQKQQLLFNSLSLSREFQLLTISNEKNSKQQTCGYKTFELNNSFTTDNNVNFFSYEHRKINKVGRFKNFFNQLICFTSEYVNITKSLIIGSVLLLAIASILTNMYPDLPAFSYISGFDPMSQRCLGFALVALAYILSMSEFTNRTLVIITLTFISFSTFSIIENVNNGVQVSSLQNLNITNITSGSQYTKDNRNNTLSTIIQSKDFDCLASTIGMMILVNSFCETNVYDYVVVKILKKAGNDFTHQITILSILTFVMSIIFGTLTAILFSNPLAIRLGEMQHMNPMNFVMITIIFSQLGATFFPSNNSNWLCYYHYICCTLGIVFIISLYLWFLCRMKLFNNYRFDLLIHKPKTALEIEKEISTWMQIKDCFLSGLTREHRTIRQHIEHQIESLETCLTKKLYYVDPTIIIDNTFLEECDATIQLKNIKLLYKTLFVTLACIVVSILKYCLQIPVNHGCIIIFFAFLLLLIQSTPHLNSHNKTNLDKERFKKDQASKFKLKNNIRDTNERRSLLPKESFDDIEAEFNIASNLDDKKKSNASQDHCSAEALISKINWHLVIQVLCLNLTLRIINNLNRPTISGILAYYIDTKSVVNDSSILTSTLSAIIWISCLSSVLLSSISDELKSVLLLSSQTNTSMIIDVDNQPIYNSIVMALTFGSTIGGMFSLLSSPVNLIAAELSSRSGYPTSFLKQIKFALPIVILSTAVCNVYIVLTVLLL